MSEFGAAFDLAQRAYDAQEPPQEWDCEEDGHQWRRHRSCEVQGETIVEYKCAICGALDVN